MAVSTELDRFRQQWLSELTGPPSDPETKPARDDARANTLLDKLLPAVAEEAGEDDEGQRPAKRPRNELLDQLISDLDEIEDTNFFGFLPLELALHVFKWLSVLELCLAAQVCRAWQGASSCDVLWYLKCRQMGWAEGLQQADRSGWKAIYRCLWVRRMHMRRNWKERLCGVREYVYSGVSYRTPILSCATFREGLVTAGYRDGTVKVWDVGGSRSMIECQHPATRHPIVCVATDQTRALLVSGAKFGMLQMWNLDKGAREGSFVCGETVSDVTVASDGSVLASSGSRMFVYRRRDADQADHAHGPYSQISAAQTEEGQTDEEGAEGVVDEEGGMWRHACGWREGGRISGLKVIGGEGYGVGVRAVVASQEMGTVRVYDPMGGAMTHEVCSWGQGWSKVSCLDVTRSHIIVGCSSVLSSQNECQAILPPDGCVQSRPARTPEGVTCVRGGEGTEGPLVATGSKDRHVRVFDTRLPVRSRCVHDWQGHYDDITIVQVDDWKALSASLDRRATLWDRRMGKLWHVEDRRWGMRYALFDGDHLVTASYPTDNEVQTMQQQAREAAELEGEEVWDTAPCSGKHSDALRCYDFGEGDENRAAPHLASVFHSTYDEPVPNYLNASLLVPYDDI